MMRPGPARFLRNAAVVAAAVIAGAVAWRAGIGPNLVAKRFAEVDPGKVYRSGELSMATLNRVVKEHGVRTIVDFGAFEPGSPADVREQRAAESLKVDRVRFQLYGDASGNPNAYVQALRIMTDPARQPVLVHCGAGTERTGVAVMLYRHIVQGVDLATAQAEAEAAGHDPDRNPVLRRVVEEWARPIVAAYRDGGQLPGIEALPEPVLTGGGAGNR